MKKIKIEDAIGRPLCHDITAMKDGFKGAWFKRGHIITEEDIPVLLDMGKKTVYEWEEKEDFIHEEEAAERIAAAIKTDNTAFTAVSEGKILMLADADGMVKVDTELLKAVNSIGDITVATLPDHYPVKKGARMASMRIVPLVTEKSQIEKAEEICSGRKPVQLLPYCQLKAAVIVTGSEFYSGRTKDKFFDIAKAKLEKYPCEIIGFEICDDDMDMICSSAEKFIAQGVQLIILSGGMSVDSDDVTVDAVKQLGADIVSYGVPAQPGNMILVAYKNDVALLGIPGAAISLPVTVFDVLLPQVFANVKFTKQELINLADGGLCQLCEKCHFPNCTFGRY